MRLCCPVILLVGPMIARAMPISYEGDSFPEGCGFTRVTHYDPTRWLDDGLLVQQIDVGGGTGEPYDGEYDHYEYDLSNFPSSPFFFEWSAITDAPDTEVDVHNGGAFAVLVGGGVRYHVNMASGLARLARGYPYPTVYFGIEPGTWHSYRLEVYDTTYFEFRIDDVVVESGEPEDVFPNDQARMIFGARYYQSEHTTQWDYVRFGIIPEPASLVLMLAGTTLVFACRRTRRT